LQDLSIEVRRSLAAILFTACLSLLPGLSSGSLACAQSLTTASRAGDLQAGGGFSVAESDYNGFRLKGATLYSSFDFTKHFGVEVDFHEMTHGQDKFYERTYEAGGRYIPKHYGLFTPYAKGMYGRGVLNYNSGYRYSDGTIFYNNIAYNILTGGAGGEYEIKPWLKARVDFEYQYWLSGLGIPHGLTPMVGTVGVAYRFGSGRPKGLQWGFPKQAPVKAAPPSRQPLPQAAEPPQ